MTFLLAMAAMDQRVLAEHVADRTAQGLGAVDHEQDRLVGVEAAVDEVGQQRARQGRVLRRAFPQAGTFTPSVLIPSATTCVRSATSMPSRIITARRTSSNRRLISPPSALAVRSTNSPEIVDLLVADVTSSTGRCRAPASATRLGRECVLEAPDERLDDRHGLRIVGDGRAALGERQVQLSGLHI